jgi:hypothetical protein
VFPLTGLSEAEVDSLRNKACRRVVPGYGEEAQRSGAGYPPRPRQASLGDYALAFDGWMAFKAEAWCDLRDQSRNPALAGPQLAQRCPR